MAIECEFRKNESVEMAAEGKLKERGSVCRSKTSAERNRGDRQRKLIRFDKSREGRAPSISAVHVNQHHNRFP